MRYVLLATLILVPIEAHAFFPIAALPLAAAFVAPAASTAISLGSIATIASGVLSAAGAVAGALSQRAQAKAQEQQAKLDASLEETATRQRDTIRRQELERTLGTIRAVRSGRGIDSPTAMAFMDEANENINSDRLVEFASGSQRVQDHLNTARNARSRGRLSLITGGINAALPLGQTAANVFS